MRRENHKISEHKQDRFITQLGYWHPAEDAEELGFVVGGADHLSPQTHNWGLQWPQKPVSRKIIQEMGLKTEKSHLTVEINASKGTGNQKYRAKPSNKDINIFS